MRCASVRIGGMAWHSSWCPVLLLLPTLKACNSVSQLSSMIFLSVLLVLVVVVSVTDQKRMTNKYLYMVC
ncbi:hypothetical protein DFH08DRAFT_902087 [Mycena albidolilacea]|uniref:Uncharacterized protein n=1 Tax=Mycena albidolilacea TaxID=1033008 RepID=A0AAD6Z4L3_9AGAR|nr:hypothetical protein DFH08DRAFT_902087 [Mycena albidolilacea]